MPQNTKIFIWQPRWNMITPVIFAGALTIFAGALPPGPHPGDGAAAMTLVSRHVSVSLNIEVRHAGHAAMDNLLAPTALELRVLQENYYWSAAGWVVLLTNGCRTLSSEIRLEYSRRRAENSQTWEAGCAVITKSHQRE